MTDAADGPIFHVEPRGWLANRMIQYMVALSFRSMVPGSRISNVQIPEWDIDHPPIELPEPVELASQHQHVEMAGLTERARTGEIRSIVYNGYGQRMENFLDVDAYRAAFRAPVANPVRFDERYLVCHVRANEILRAGADPNYPLTPIEFYADIVEETGLIPVFMGQTAPSPYMDRLRARFPQAVILETRDIVLDFETIREAKNIAFGCSTYGWLAAWLSHADRIFMAVTGLLNPMQYHLIDLLPFGDPRYRFYLFPINYFVPLEHHAEAHQRMARLWRLVPHELLRRLILEAPRFDPPTEKMLELFDPEYYLATNGDVTRVLGADNAEGARQHYWRSGVRERRLPFKLSRIWYAARYPTAALEVAQGDYSSFAHHYVAVGRERGYQPLPGSNDSWFWWDAEVSLPAVASLPAIADLAREVVWLEREELLGAEPEVSLGESFANLLKPEDAEHFVRQTATKPMRTYRLRDVVLDASMMALFSGREPIQETLYLMTPGDYEYARVKPLHPEPTDPSRHYILGCNVSSHNYFHWMTQSLPAIDWGLRNRRHPNVALALPPLQPWQEESLALLGHADTPRLTLQSSRHYWLASAEYAEFLGDRMVQATSRAATATYSRLREAVAPAPDGGSEIYVARTDATNRVMANEDELIAMLERQGVRIVVPGELPVTRQIAIFRGASLVIGPHGAGLSNIMGCEPGIHVYEFVPSHYPNFCFNRLAQSCGLHYWGDVFPSEAGDGNPHHRTWRVDLKVVAARLDVIRTRIAAAAEAHAG
jgi:capsular polysaccharide biosynthesis protein